MKIQTEAFYLGKSDLHSSKTGKDFTKYSLIIEGGFATFIVPKKRGDEINKNAGKILAEFDKTHNPQRCNAEIALDFTERGNFTSLLNIGA